jgi:hypothetical protein
MGKIGNFGDKVMIFSQSLNSIKTAKKQLLSVILRSVHGGRFAVRPM